MVAGLTAIPLLLAGCSGSERMGRSPDATTSPTAEVQPERPSGEPGTTRSVGSEPGPLVALLGFDPLSGRGDTAAAPRPVTDPGDLTEEELTRKRRFNEAVAGCMRDQGFEYVIVAPRADAAGRVVDPFKLPADQFAKQYGYGFSTIDAVVTDGSDPNAAIRARLSDRAKTAYDEALNGRPTASPRADGRVVGGGMVDSGCFRAARELVYGPDDDAAAAQEARRFSGLLRDLEALGKRIDEHPRMVEAERRWSDCMADARLPGLSSPALARRAVMDRLVALLRGRPGSVADVMRKLDPAKVAELRRYELTVAEADYRCRQDGYDATHASVRNAAEREFVVDQKDALETFREFRSQEDR